jgi:hypothetical protein
MRSRLIEVYEQVRPEAPDCSIVVPVYNGARFLPESLGAVLAQRGVTCDIVISDDGSDDGSLETILGIVRPYTGPHSVRVFRTDVPAIVENMPLLVEASRCTAIVQAHQDDISDPQRARVLSRRLSGKARLVTSLARIRKDGKTTEPAPAATARLRENSSFGALLRSSGGVMAGARYGMHRDIFRLFPPLGAEHLSHGHDVLLYMRAKMLGGAKIVYRPIITIGDHPDRGSHQMFDRQDPATRGFDFALRRMVILSVALKDLAHAAAAGSVPPERAERIGKRLAEARLHFVEELALNRERAIQRGFKLSWTKAAGNRGGRALPL